MIVRYGVRLSARIDTSPRNSVPRACVASSCEGAVVAELLEEWVDQESGGASLLLTRVDLTVAKGDGGDIGDHDLIAGDRDLQRLLRSGLRRRERNLKLVGLDDLRGLSRELGNEEHQQNRHHVHHRIDVQELSVDRIFALAAACGE